METPTPVSVDIKAFKQPSPGKQTWSMLPCFGDGALGARNLGKDGMAPGLADEMKQNAAFRAQSSHPHSLKMCDLHMRSEGLV